MCYTANAAIIKFCLFVVAIDATVKAQTIAATA